MTCWQDLVFGVGTLVFCASAVNVLTHTSSRLPRKSSLAYAGTLAAFVVAQCSLGLYITAGATALQGALWLAIAIWRPMR